MSVLLLPQHSHKALARVQELLLEDLDEVVHVKPVKVLPVVAHRPHGLPVLSHLVLDALVRVPHFTFQHLFKSARVVPVGLHFSHQVLLGILCEEVHARRDFCRPCNLVV